MSDSRPTEVAALLALAAGLWFTQREDGAGRARPAAAPAMARVLARVVDSAGRALGGVRVQRDGEPAGTSAPGGAVELELVPRRAGELALLDFRHAGFARAWRGVRLDAGSESRPRPSAPAARSKRTSTACSRSFCSSAWPTT